MSLWRLAPAVSFCSLALSPSAIGVDDSIESSKFSTGGVTTVVAALSSQPSRRRLPKATGNHHHQVKRAHTARRLNCAEGGGGWLRSKDFLERTRVLKQVFNWQALKSEKSLPPAGLNSKLNLLCAAAAGAELRDDATPATEEAFFIIIQ
jgi:hypothetical protein